MSALLRSATAKRSLLKATAGMTGLALAAAAVAIRSTLTVVRVHGHSMEPTFVDGDRLLVRRTGTFRRGDVAVFATPQWLRVPGDPEWLVKRVSAVSGGQLTVLGDNPHSVDSRAFGPVPAATALGVVIRRLDPPRSISPAHAVLPPASDDWSIP
jgi:signal peptidase I